MCSPRLSDASCAHDSNMICRRYDLYSIFYCVSRLKNRSQLLRFNNAILGTFFSFCGSRGHFSFLFQTMLFLRVCDILYRVVGGKWLSLSLIHRAKLRRNNTKKYYKCSFDNSQKKSINYIITYS